MPGTLPRGCHGLGGGRRIPHFDPLRRLRELQRNVLDIGAQELARKELLELHFENDLIAKPASASITCLR
jgi:hypothetical protein